MSWISLADAVGAVRFLLSEEIAGAVNVCAPEPVTNAEFTATLARRLRRPAFFRAPAFALRMVFGQMADEALLAGARVVPKRLMEAGFRFEHTSLEGALEAVLTAGG
jgi:NAD dependent epimerase/dehydratase family enzyme